MISVARAREIALAMPEAVEGEHMRHPDFRVRKKIFATLWPAEQKAVVFVEPALHQKLIEARPGAYSTNGWSEKFGALNVHLPHIDENTFRQLVWDSWLAKAPSALKEAHRQP